MPLTRYFLLVGGVLLALLFVADAYLPKLPLADTANADLPVIRIHTDRKWPAPVVYDTSLPTIVPAQTASSVARFSRLQRPKRRTIPHAGPRHQV